MCAKGIMLPPTSTMQIGEHEEQPADEVALSSRYVEGFVP